MAHEAICGGAVSARTGRPPGDSRRSAAAGLIERHGDAVFSTARRYSATREDAEDAYQRGLEILLTKAPDLPEDELVPWLKTVVKHEAFAIWRGRERTSLGGDEVLEHAPSPAPAPEERAERYERLAVGAEAIRRLKPQEVRCLLLRAEGLSYKQICERTGWTYTKVNRCLTEGRRRFLDRIAGIESGAECDRLAPLLSSLADGEATADDMAALRPHLRSCLGCRALLRAYREVPHRVAELVPLVGAEPVADLPGLLWRWIDSAGSRAHGRANLVAAKLQTLPETVGAAKVVAVAASGVALAGGTLALRALEDPGRARADAPASAGAEPLLELSRASIEPAHADAPATAPQPLVEAAQERATMQAVEAPPPPDTSGLQEAPIEEGPSARPPPTEPWYASDYHEDRSPPDVPNEATVPLSGGSTTADDGEMRGDLDPLDVPRESDPPAEPPVEEEPTTEAPAPTDAPTAGP